MTRYGTRHVRTFTAAEAHQRTQGTADPLSHLITLVCADAAKKAVRHRDDVVTDWRALVELSPTEDGTSWLRLRRPEGVIPPSAALIRVTVTGIAATEQDTNATVVALRARTTPARIPAAAPAPAYASAA